MSSPPSDSHNNPPDAHSDDPLISGLEGSARPPKSFDSWKQFRRNMTSLSWRCLATTLSLSLLIIGLHAFSRMGKLSQAEQRGFNAITILLGSFASLGLGSMLGYLGSMLRWRLLARKKYKMQDIELLLAMQSPTGSAKLLIEHVRKWRWSLTTFIVMLYLLVNITGRFSVAIFGLTYNLVDDSVEVYPTLTTNWTSSALLAKNATDFEAVERSLLSYLDLVRGGLSTYGGLPSIGFDIGVPQTLTSRTFMSLMVSLSHSEGLGVDGLKLRYNIPNFLTGMKPQEASDHEVHSSASCTMLRLDGNKYWRDYGSDSQTFKGMSYKPYGRAPTEDIKFTKILEIDWKDEGNGEAIAEALRVLDHKSAWPRHGAEQVTWAAPLVGGSNGSSVTYVVYHETAWECTSSLFETLRGGPHPNPLFDSATLFLLPIVERVERSGELEPAGHLDNSGGGPSVGGTTSIVYRSFTDLKSQLSPSVGVQTLNFYQNGTGGSATQKNYYNLYIAGLVARLPIAAIAYGKEVFPRMQKDPEADWTQHVETALEVKWGRVALVAGAIVASQILAITAVLYYCRNVYVREDSYLATAELLKTLLSLIDDGDTMTAKELEDSLDELVGLVSYGTIRGAQGDKPKVALGREVEYNFPRYPPFPKCSIFNR